MGRELKHEKIQHRKKGTEKIIKGKEDNKPGGDYTAFSHKSSIIKEKTKQQTKALFSRHHTICSLLFFHFNFLG